MDYSAHLKRLQNPPSKKEVGDQGEALAEKYLLRIGYEIREKNVRLGRDEIDMIAFDPVDQALVFVEVKTRTKKSLEFGPEMDAHPRKLAKIRRSARRWVSDRNYEGGYRLDLIYIIAGRVSEHIKEVSWE